MATCAYKTAKASLLHLRNSDFEDFKKLQCPDISLGLPSFPIPHLAFISVKVCKAFQSVLGHRGMNQGHGSDWASEALNLDENYRKSSSTGVGRYVLFNSDVMYSNLTAAERSAILKHTSFQVLPDD